MTTAYVSIGNSDDKLTQKEWAEFYSSVNSLWEMDTRIVTHGRWTSSSASRWQNACWCVEFPEVLAEKLKESLRRKAGRFRQDSIAWADVPTTTFLAPPSEQDGVNP